VRFNLSLTHEEIAQIIGISRETVTRALTEMRNKMLITTNGPSVVIRNRPALEAMAAA
jgi:CRP/FNR family transcriptional regulator